MSRNVSIFISRFLNYLGYSADRVKLRQKMFEKIPNQLWNCSLVICGSKSEGLTLLLENDLDIMLVINSLECREEFDDYSSKSGLIKFQLITLDSTSPGYALLKCISLNNELCSDLKDIVLFDVGKGTYFLSSVNLKQVVTETLRMFSSSPGNNGFVTYARDSQGPSCSSRAFGMWTDNVFAIRCHSPHLIASWKRRRRRHDWPSKKLINTVSSLEAHVVPVGYKDSPFHCLEWRICFTKAEICLIRSLNDCQYKLIILLKMIARHVLKPICKEISSYVVKNLVLWMAEKYPSKTFVEDKLLELLKRALKRLKSRIINKKLPSYMIEKRNLFADRISDRQIFDLCEMIEILLNEDSKMLLRCPKIRVGWNTFRLSPDQFYLKSEKRRSLELKVLVSKLSLVQYAFQTFANVGFCTIQQLLGSSFSQDVNMQLFFRDAQFILPDVLELMGRGETLMNAYTAAMRINLS